MNTTAPDLVAYADFITQPDLLPIDAPFTDSHCHLNRLDLTPYAEGQGLQTALQQAWQNGVGQCLAVSVDLDDYAALAAIVELGKQAAQGPVVGMSVGVHPCETREDMARATVGQLCSLGQRADVWAVGETGLDYHYSQEWATEQQACFKRHLQAGHQLGKPVIVHTRNARADTLAILREARQQFGAVHGVLHCFTEDWDTASAALELGYYVSFSGIVSFKNAEDLRAVVKQMPPNRILVETDSPYLAPIPYRGKPNEPKYLPSVAQVLADVHQMSLLEMARLTRHNFVTLLSQARAQRLEMPPDLRKFVDY